MIFWAKNESEIRGGVNNVVAQRTLEQKFIREQFNSSVTFSKKDYEGRLARDGQSHLRAVAMIKVKNPSTGDIETHTARQDFSLTVPPMVSIAVSRSASIKMENFVVQPKKSVRKRRVRVRHHNWKSARLSSSKCRTYSRYEWTFSWSKFYSVRKNSFYQA